MRNSKGAAIAGGISGVESRAFGRQARGGDAGPSERGKRELWGQASFHASRLVLMTDGSSTPISQIEAGDKIAVVLPFNRLNLRGGLYSLRCAEAIGTGVIYRGSADASITGWGAGG